MAAYRSPRPGEWVQPVRRGYRMACCDCGLVHVLDFRVVKYGRNQTKVQFRAWRDEEKTRKRRKRGGIVVTKAS